MSDITLEQVQALIIRASRCGSSSAMPEGGAKWRGSSKFVRTSRRPQRLAIATPGFAADCLELRIAGPPAAGDDVRRVRSVVRARLALYGGTVDIDDAAGRRAARIRLPLITSHA